MGKQGIERFLSKCKAEARVRETLIVRAKEEQGILVKGMGGYANTSKLVIDLETFRGILDQLSWLAKNEKTTLKVDE